MGWLESARRTSLADRIAEANPAGAASAQAQDRVSSNAAKNVDVDEDEDQLAAYNNYLARINGEPLPYAREESNPTAE
jgi:hypothetical protein